MFMMYTLIEIMVWEGALNSCGGPGFSEIPCIADTKAMFDDVQNGRLVCNDLALVQAVFMIFTS